METRNIYVPCTQNFLINLFANFTHKSAIAPAWLIAVYKLPAACGVCQSIARLR
jgi:hypothetical protein